MIEMLTLKRFQLVYFNFIVLGSRPLFLDFVSSVLYWVIGGGRKMGWAISKKVLPDSELHNCELISRAPFTAGANAGSPDNALGKHFPWKTVALNDDKHQGKSGFVSGSSTFKGWLNLKVFPWTFSGRFSAFICRKEKKSSLCVRNFANFITFNSLSLFHFL